MGIQSAYSVQAGPKYLVHEIEYLFSRIEGRSDKKLQIHKCDTVIGQLVKTGNPSTYQQTFSLKSF